MLFFLSARCLEFITQQGPPPSEQHLCRHCSMQVVEDSRMKKSNIFCLTALSIAVLETVLFTPHSTVLLNSSQDISMSDESQLAPHLYKMLSGESLDNTLLVRGVLTAKIGFRSVMMKVPGDCAAAEWHGCLQPDQIHVHEESWLCLVTQTGIDTP